MTLTTVAKSEKVLERVIGGTAPEGEPVAFIEVEGAGPPTTMLLAHTTWLNLGEPDRVTVTIAGA